MRRQASAHSRDMGKWITSWLVAACALAVAGGSASCGSSSDGVATGGAGATAAGGGGDGGATSGSGGDGITSGSGGEGGRPPACAEVEEQTQLEPKPVDIIFAVGNNGSLAQEIAAVEDNINASFASIIGASGIDYRVILVSRSGSHQFNICVEAPLGGVPVGQCATADNNAQPVHNPPVFYHYSAIINSDDAWCKLLGAYDGTIPDEYGQAPNGWSEWLRPDAAKVFVVLSDSSINCLHGGIDLDDGPQQPSMSDIPQAEQAAADFDDMLLGLSSTHFGTAADRNYRWHSIVGLAAKDPNNITTPWLPTDDLSLVKCTGDTNPVSPALGYQALSRLTDGLRFPICAYNDFDVVFNTIAQGIVDGAQIACEVPLPTPPDGQEINFDSIEVTFTASGGATETFTQVPSAADCAGDSFYIEDELIKLCPDACAKVQDPAVTMASLGVRYDCLIDSPQ